MIRSGVIVLSSIGLAAWFGMMISQNRFRLPLLVIALGLSLVLLLGWKKMETPVLVWLFLAMGMQSWGGLELGQGIPNITVDRYLILLALLIFARGRVRPRRLGTFSTSILLLSGFYAGYSLVAVLLRAVSLGEELLNWVSTAILPFLAMFLGLQVEADEDWWRIFLAGVPIVVWYLFLPALYEWITQTPFLPGAWLMSGGGGSLRPGSLAGAATNLSYSVVLLAPLTIYPFTTARTRRQRVGDVVVFLANLATAFFSGFRTAWVVTLVVVILAVLLIPRARPSLLRFLLLGSLLLVVFSGQILSSEYVTDWVLNPHTLRSRSESLSIQLQRASQNLLFGEGGAGAWRVVTGSEGLRGSHNTYATVLLYYGLIGLLLYVSIWGVAGWAAFLVWRRIRDRGSSPGAIRAMLLILVLVAAAITAATHDIRFFVTNNCLLGFSIGLCVQQAEIVLNKQR